MASAVRTLSIIVAIYNTVMWILNWVMIGVYIHVFWKYDSFYAGMLLLHVFLSNATMTSVFTTVSNMLFHDDLESAYPEPKNEEITISRRTSRYPPPFWNEHWDAMKEV